MKEITLNWVELGIAAIQGCMRQVDAMKRNLPDRHGYEGSGWENHIEGAAGEMAFAKAVDRFWSGSIGTFKNGGDVGNVQVRTRSRHEFDLIVRDDDRSEDAFVLVTGRAPTFRVVGWIYGKDAKQPQWLQKWGGRPPAYFVQAKHLKPI